MTRLIPWVLLLTFICISSKCQGEKRWRGDNYCGSNYLLPDGNVSECDPHGMKPCCGNLGKCGESEFSYCYCSECVDYRVVKEIRKSGENCSVVNIRGFLKHACYNATSGQITYKCANSDVSYTKVTNSGSYKLESVSSVCEYDTHVYQACGFSIEKTNDEVLCGGYICNKKWAYREYRECADEECSVDNRDCFTLRGNTATTICDDKCDTSDCRDESYCNGYRYGFECQGKYISIPSLCATDTVCNNTTYQRDCNSTNSALYTCYSYKDRGKILPILNYARCSVFVSDPLIDAGTTPYCANYFDQTNCTDVGRVAGRCLVNGFMTSISKYVVCDFTKTTDDIELCDNGLENKCHMTSTSCKVHKHKMCNKVFDCPDESDERHDICSLMTKQFTCERSFYPNGSRELPLSWVKDNVTDCINGDDENDEKWSFCGNSSEGTLRVRSDLETSCQNVYLCPGFTKSFVKLEQLCDGVESCGLENDVCEIARDSPILSKAAVRDGTVLDVCGSNERLKSMPCHLQGLANLPGHVEIFGAERITAVNVPKTKVDCRHLFGESYVYTSCMNLCTEVKASCPLNDKPLMYNSCPGQFNSRFYTLANSSYLTFVRRSNDGKYHHQNYFQCKNKKCIEHKQVCDLIDDCGDNSDEDNCVNHIVCKNTINKSKKHRISLEQKCDGIYDCFDLSDECNNECGKEILENWVIKCLCWLMGISAVILNTITVMRGLYELGNCETEKMLNNKALASVIGFGDLLIGVYLIVLSVYDSMVFGKQFCSQQAQWLTGTACSVLGVVSTTGSQLSLFAMTVLSIQRVYGLIGDKFVIPSRVNRKAAFKTIILILGVVLMSLSIAIIPIIPEPHLENYFVQGMYYDPNNKLFVGFPDKERHLNILKAYFNNTKMKQTNISETITTDMTWKKISEKVDDMFSKQYGTLKRAAVHFYGNDGLCLFKYFARTDDARRNRQTLDGVTDISDHKGDLIMWLMLGINLTCFVLIAICYMYFLYNLMNMILRTSSKKSGSLKNLNIKRKKREIQNIITLIIVTDFLCWVPLIIISGLHNLKVIDASLWYASFSMILLPINSVINPLLYDKFLRKAVLVKINLLVTSFINCISKRWRAEEEDRRYVELGMEAIPETTETMMSRTGSLKPVQLCLVRAQSAVDDIVEDYQD